MRAAFIFPHKVENFFVNSATTFLTQFLKKISSRLLLFFSGKRLTAGAEIFIKRQKEEGSSSIFDEQLEEELFDAAKATTVTNGEKTRGPMTNLHTIIPFKMMVRQ